MATNPYRSFQLDPELLRALGEFHARQYSGRTTPTSGLATAPTQPVDEKEWWEYLTDPLQAIAGSAGSLSGRLGQYVAPEAYRRAREARGLPGDPGDLLDQEELAYGPTLGATAVEAIAPGEPETAAGRVAKTVGEFGAEVLTDPFTFAGGAGLLSRGGKALKAAGAAAKAGKVAEAAKLGATGVFQAASSPLAAAGYAPDLVRGVEQTYEAYKQGQIGGTEAAIQGGILSGLGAALGAGVAGEVGGLRAAGAEARAARLAEKKAIREGSKPIPQVGVTEVGHPSDVRRGLQALEFPDQQIDQIPNGEAQTILQNRTPYPEWVAAKQLEAQQIQILEPIEGAPEAIPLPEPIPEAVRATEGQLEAPESILEQPTSRPPQVSPEYASESPRTVQREVPIRVRDPQTGEVIGAATEPPTQIGLDRTQPTKVESAAEEALVQPVRYPGLSPEQASRMVEIEAEQKQVLEAIRRGTLGGTEKGQGMHYSAIKRAITGDLTAKELARARKEATTLAPGRQTTVVDSGERAIILKRPAFGRVKVDVGGVERTLSVDELNPIQITDTEAKAWAAERWGGVEPTQPTVSDLPQPEVQNQLKPTPDLGLSPEMQAILDELDTLPEAGLSDAKKLGLQLERPEGEIKPKVDIPWDTRHDSTETVVNVDPWEVFRAARSDVLRPQRARQVIKGVDKLTGARDFLMGAKQAGVDVRIPQLHFSGNELRIGDGFHRMLAASELGYEKIPIRIDSEDAYLLREAGVLHGQRQPTEATGLGRPQGQAEAGPARQGQQGVAEVPPRQVGGESEELSLEDLIREAEAAVEPQFQTKETPDRITDTTDLGETGSALGPVSVKAFHGTTADISKVDIDRGEIGFHVGSTPQQSNARVTLEGGKTPLRGANIMPLQVDMDNPLRLPDLDWSDPRAVLNELNNRKLITEADYDAAKATNAGVRELLQAKGYDGIVYKNEGGGGDSYIVFDQKQVKSAISPEHEFQLRQAAAIKEALPGLANTEQIYKRAKRIMHGKWRVNDEGHVVADLPNGGQFIQRSATQLELNNTYVQTYGKLPKGAEPVGQTITHGQPGSTNLRVLSKYGPKAAEDTFEHEMLGHSIFSLGLVDRPTQELILKRHGSQEGWAQAVERGEYVRPVDKQSKSIVRNVVRALKRLARSFFGDKSQKEFDQIASMLESIPQRFEDLQQGKLQPTPLIEGLGGKPQIAGEAASPTRVKPIPTSPEAKAALEQTPFPVDITKAPGVETGAKPGGDPDVFLNYDKEIRTIPGLSEADQQGLINHAKALDPLVRKVKMDMSPESLDLLAHSEWGDATPDRIKQLINKWSDPEAVSKGMIAETRATSMVLQASQLDTIIKKGAAVASGEKAAWDAYEEAEALTQALAMTLGGQKRAAGQLLRSLGTARTKLPGERFFDRWIQSLRDKGFSEQVLNQIKLIKDKYGLRAAVKIAGDELAEPDFWSKAVGLRTLGLLTGPATFAVNFGGNVAFHRLRRQEEKLAGYLAEKFAERQSRKTGVHVEPARYRGEAKARVMGYRLAFTNQGAGKRFIKEMKDVVFLRELPDRVEGLHPLRDEPMTKAELQKYAGPSGMVGPGTKPGEAIRIGAKGLEVADNLAKQVSFSEELAVQAYRHNRRALGMNDADAYKNIQATLDEIEDFRADLQKRVNDARSRAEQLQSVKSGKAAEKGTTVSASLTDIDENDWRLLALNTAHDVALRNTYQTGLGKFGRSLQDIQQNHILGKLLVPFIRTPINIYKEAGKRLPGAFLFRDFKKMDVAEKTLAIAESVTGVTLAAAVVGAVYGLEDKGITVTGGGPSDRRQWSNLYATGWRPYSFKFGDTYIDYSRLEPISSAIGATADILEASESSKNADQFLAKLVESGKANFLNKTFITGLEGLFSALHQPDREAMTYLKQFITSWVPTGVRAAARTVDPVIRQQDSPLQALQASIPLASMGLEAKRDTAGQERTRPLPFSPIYVSREQKGPAADAMREFDRLTKALGGKGLPSLPRRTYRVFDQEVRLNDQQMGQLYDQRRTLIEMIGQRLLKDPTYKAASDDRKWKIIQGFLSRQERGLKDRLKREAFQRLLQQGAA